jgi:hypothetical protein
VDEADADLYATRRRGPMKQMLDEVAAIIDQPVKVVLHSSYSDYLKDMQSYNIQEEPDMYANNKADQIIRDQMEQKRVDEEVALKLALLEVLGDDDFTDGTVFKFDKVFVTDGKVYAYAVIKANGLWYTTGPKSPKGYSWEEFLLWLVGGIPATQLTLMVPASLESEV